MAREARPSEDVLKSYGISFETHILSLDKLKDLNKQSGLLVEYLLDFRNTLTREDNHYLEKRLDDEDPKLIPSPTIQEQRNQHAREEYRKNFDIANCEAKVDLAYAIYKAARAIRSEEENRWTNVIVNLLFGTLRGAALELEQPNPYRRVEDALGKIRMDCDRPWTFGRIILAEKAQLLDKDIKITGPKPDLCLSFHAYSPEREDGGPMHADSYITNFGKNSLTELYKQNEKARFIPYSSPFDRFYRDKDRQYCDQSCFPWAICEWKKHMDPEKPSNSILKALDIQIARAGAIAATMFANITAAWHGKPNLENIRPVVCFSFVGAATEVRRIWSGSLANVVHNVELCWIIERLHRWAIHHLRPWLSSCIDAWNAHMCPGAQCALHSSDQKVQPQPIIENRAIPETTTQEENELEEGEVVEDTARQVKKANASKARARDNYENGVDESWEPSELKRQGTASSVASVWTGVTAKVFKGRRNPRRGQKA